LKAIILSAGQGTRLLPLTRKIPKCALAVSGRSVLEWQLHEIAQCAIDEVVVVTGFAAESVDDIARKADGFPVRTLHNHYYAQYDNLGTCWMARSEMEGPFVLLNGDTLFEAAVLRRLLTATEEIPITVATDRKDAYDADDMKVIVSSGRLARVGKRLDIAKVNGEAIGMSRFTATGAALFREMLDRMLTGSDGAKLWYLSAVDALARRGQVGVRWIDGLSWGEIDDRADLEAAQAIVASWPRPEAPLAGQSLGAVSGN
jgi:L-glutamine-phosphate cytidylyltransferase